MYYGFHKNITQYNGEKHVENIYNKKCFLNTILIYENNVILKTFYGFDITRINYIFKYIKAEDSYLKQFLKKHNITVYTVLLIK